MWFFLFFPLTAVSDSLDSMRHFIPLESVPYLTGSIPLISTTYLIHHICPMWFFLFIPLTAVSDSLDFMRHFVPLKSVPYLTGSIPLISTTHLIHHICPMWFFLFIPLTAISDSLDFMRHFVPLKSVPYFAAASSHCFSSISQTLGFIGISDSLDFMRRFAPLKSVPYLTGLILLTPPQGKKSTLLRCVLFCIDAKKEQYLIYTMVSFLFVLPGIVQKNYFRNASSRTGCMSGRGSA